MGAKLRLPDEHGKEHGFLLSHVDPAALQFSGKLISYLSDIMGESLEKDEELFVNLSVHLHSSLYRLRNGLTLFNPMTEEIKRMYRYTFEMILSILPLLEEETGIAIPEEEIAYIVLHFQSALERKKALSHAKKAIIVCTMGIGMSQLLQAKVQRKFDSIEVIDVVSEAESHKMIRERKPDFVISTVPIEKIECPSIVINPLLSESEEKKLEDFVAELQNPYKKNTFPFLKECLDKELFFLNWDGENVEDLLAVMADKLVQKGIVAPGYIESVKQREKISSTYIGSGIAIPHGNPEWVYSTGIACARLKTPVQWGEGMVWLLFMLALKKEEKERNKYLFQEMNQLMDQDNFLEEVKKKTTIEDIYEMF
ncbi:PTS sugar transporter subunit IIA [Aneurinibacillus terranovensis]|uniref:BglG family transcription antiterminator n=1 Tax=Aneurinibacillus terranovensis TaxID=278991 RepID=UPI0012DFB575